MMPLLAGEEEPEATAASAAAAGSTTTGARPSSGYSALPHRTYTDPSRLAPEDAFYAHSPPRHRGGTGAATAHGEASPSRGSSARRQKLRRRKGIWKKLLWVKQSYPDNYTDPPTFLSHLQRNPRLQPYEFWPLVADSMVIVQHVCSVAIFVCCFVGIYLQQISPVSVVSWASAGAVLGWVLWDTWIGQEEEQAQARSMQVEQHQVSDHHQPAADEQQHAGGGDDAASVGSTLTSSHGSTTTTHGLGLTLSTTASSSSAVPSTRAHSRNISSTSLQALSPVTSPGASLHPAAANGTTTLWSAHHGYFPPYDAPAPLLSPRNQQRLATAKSAVLIYVALLGLSPILKSLTQSTTSDSIWAMSAWLMCINVFTFDYGGGTAPGTAQFPASLSTNAALMASTVLASRLATVTHVFSLTLFSIEVFGLFPVFRRHLRHRSWSLHILLTVLLIVSAGAGLGVVLRVGRTTRTAATVGVLVWGLGMVLAMGGCSWWLIGLQRYKNVVIGPWDPARPIIRAGG